MKGDLLSYKCLVNVLLGAGGRPAMLNPITNKNQSKKKIK